MPPDTVSAAIFPHIRIVMGIALGLGITRLLTGTARLRAASAAPARVLGASGLGAVHAGLAQPFLVVGVLAAGDHRLDL